MFVRKLTAVLKAKSERDGVEPLRVQRQQVLQPQNQRRAGRSSRREGQHAQRIDEPSLLDRGVDPGEPVEPALHRRRARARGRCAFPRKVRRCSRPAGRRDRPRGPGPKRFAASRRWSWRFLRLALGRVGVMRRRASTRKRVARRARRSSRRPGESNSGRFECPSLRRPRAREGPRRPRRRAAAVRTNSSIRWDRG